MPESRDRLATSAPSEPLTPGSPPPREPGAFANALGGRRAVPASPRVGRERPVEASLRRLIPGVVGRRRVPRASAGAALAAVTAAACGAPRYVPLAVTSPAPLDDSTAQVGPLRLRLRLGPEWVELRAFNAGDAPVALAADGVTLVEDGGPTHRLVEAGRVYALRYAGGAAAAGPEARSAAPAPFPRWTVDFESSALAAAHRPVAEALLPAWAGGVPAERREVRPGGTLELTLFAAEHVVLAPDGRVLVGPLLGERVGDGVADGREWPPAGGPPAPGEGERDARTVRLTVPVRVGSTWRDAVVVARLRPRAR